MVRVNRRRLGITACLVVVAMAVPVARFAHTMGTIWYLRNIGYGNAQRVPYARDKLHSDNRLIRDAAARGLGSIEPKAAPAVPDLLVALRTDSPGVATSAAAALGYIHSHDSRDAPPLSQDVLKTLIEALDHPDGEIRRYAAYAIHLIGPRARSAIPALKRLLQDEHMAYMAAQALGSMGPAACDCIPDINALLSSTNPGCRAAAETALSRLGPLSKESITAIEQLLSDDVDFVRNAAQKALGR